MTLSPLAGKPAPASLLIDVDRLIGEYYSRTLDMADPAQRVSFGTSGHRGTSTNGSFTERHILAITQAICDYRKAQGIDGPLMLGCDTHALSAPAQSSALEVLAANGVAAWLQSDDLPTPTPVISHAILAHNRRKTAGDNGQADGIIITPSHNPPADGGFKYNPPNGGPADTDATSWIQSRANDLLAKPGVDLKRVPLEAALRAATTRQLDFASAYIDDLPSVVDCELLSKSRLKLGVDPLGGASVHYWPRIAERYSLDLTVVNPRVDPTFSFMTVDRDGKIRMDCSSPYAMAGLIGLREKYDVAFGNDPDADRHGIVARSSGLLNPNHYLAVAIEYLFTHRPQWPSGAAIGKTLVSSGLIDRVAVSLGRAVYEVPVGFKWFVDGLFSGACAFGGEESAGASFLRRDGGVWTTDKDGLILNLLAAEIMARTGVDPGERYLALAKRFGAPLYTRVDQPATPAQKEKLKKLSPQDVARPTLAGEPIQAKLTSAPGNGAAIGGLKVVAENGWFAARPSGTEDVYKIYAESFRDEKHLDAILADAREIVAAALA